MRLVRLQRQQSRVADDVRAALASLGRGSTVIGGIALVGVGTVTERPIEAVVLLPHGVIIVIGVDLPDPALRLEAPLGAEWKADGWPLVADDDAINPATEALDVSQACEQRIAALVPGTGPVGTIVAVGPYVETVDQPATDLAGPVRVLHPTPTTMLAATVSLATAHRPRSVDQVRALIRGLAPEAPEFSDEVLLGEGFSRFTDDSPPESLWDSGPLVPSQVGPVGSTGVAAAAGSSSATLADSTAANGGQVGPDPAGPASLPAPAKADTVEPTSPAAAAPTSLAAGAAKPSSQVEEPPAAALLDPASHTAGPTEPTSPAGDSPAAGSPVADRSGWHTKTPVPAEAEPAPSPAEDSAADSPAADLGSASPSSGAVASLLSAETERTEVLPPQADSEQAETRPAPAEPEQAETRPAPADPERTEDFSPSGASERTETPPPPAAFERTEKLPLPADPEQAETRPAEPKRAENFPPSADSDRTEKLPSPASHGRAETRPTPADPTHTEDFSPSGDPERTETPLPDPERTEKLPAPALPLFPGATVPPQPTRPGDLPTDTENPAARPQPPADSPRPFPTPRPTPRETAPTPKTVRWIPLAAIGLLVALVVAAVAAATSGDDTASAPTAGPPTAATQPPPQTTTPVAQSLQFSLRAADHDQRCASHAFGDAQASLQQTSCSGVRRASYAADVDGRAAAVTIGIVEFPDAAQAAAFKAVADTPGGGGVLDLAAETGKWGATPAPRFENAAYASKADGTSVRIVQAVWAPGPSTPDDPGLTRAVQAALDLPAQ
ncbi:hypothetical protein SAMN05421837_10841 [Amycolatopsis pretoriensis]|uniref:Uncharacterized protein n=1 Tax=Amycolatopsis pretoriensis TaxID=218821 RepID=A0A1H5RAI2_9PSEU|nr:hypothetical protein [Amycolatopsis pretoriensis]SEF35395.1 hypothetical protein SAMN05421837_10841 [Amycolatopsis pretoriensis]